MIPENLSYVPRHDFDSEDLDMLEQAFESVWPQSATTTPPVPSWTRRKRRPLYAACSLHSYLRV